MISSLLRKTAMVMAVPAVVAASSTAPALASSHGHDKDYDSVHIKVCKVVKDDDHKDHKPVAVVCSGREG